MISYDRSNEKSVFNPVTGSELILKLTGSHANSVFLSSLRLFLRDSVFPFVGAQDPCALLVLSNREGGFESCALSRHDPPSWANSKPKRLIALPIFLISEQYSETI